MVRLLIFVCVLVVLPLQQGWAQTQLRMRTGGHDDYSRLVFDWEENVDYQTQTPAKGTLIVTFQKNASLDASALQANKLANVFGVKVLSESPLKISIDIPKESRTRSFRTGERVVIDIYNPPGGAQSKPQVQAQAKPQTQPKPQEQADWKYKTETPAPQTKEAKKIAQKDVKKKPAEPQVEHKEPLAVEKVVKEQLAKEQLAKEQLDRAAPSLKTTLEAGKEGNIPAHVITITSTQSVGVAVFESYGDLWMVTDQDEFYLKPQINGPNPELFPEFKEKDLEGGKAYATKVPGGAHVRGQGGGLLWRVVVSSETEEADPPYPMRAFESQDGARGGTISWPFKEASKVLDFKDPVSGETFKVVTTKNSKDFAGPSREFVDFDVITSYVGLVIRPKVDDLMVKVTADGLEISRPGGLALTSEPTLAVARNRRLKSDDVEGGKVKASSPRIYSFREWQMGGIDVATENENIILGELRDKTDGDKLESIITLAKMYLSNGVGAESLGFLSFAQEEGEALESNPEFLALRGAAHALAWNSEEAFRDLSIKSLEPFEEVQYWRAYALADLSDWQQAYEVMPADLDTLYSYPEAIRSPLALVLAEVALRAGNVDMGEELLKMAEDDKENLSLPMESSLKYLKGEASRQAGYPDETKKLWKSLAKGVDDLYRAKAGLALTRLRMEDGSLTQEKAIDRLERLRYAWRGDQLEASISYWLGNTYFAGGDYVKGLNIMREATTFAAGTRLGKRITEEMTQVFTDLFIGDKLGDVSALDAVALYEQFGELTPAGPKGDKVVENLAERLVQADLLGRAGDMLALQVEHRLEGDEAARVAVRLAAIRLIDAKPDKAFEALDKAINVLRTLPEEIATPVRFQEISLLRARAHSQAKKADQALAILNGMELTPVVNRLRADIAWKAGYWDDAADALNDVILDYDISLTRPLKEEYSVALLNRAIALNLASDRIALANMREKYTDAMAQTEKSRMFEVVTRPRQNAALADRDTLLNIVSEVDIFEGFLESYRASQTPSN